jgi:hypothetical protein
VSNLLQIGLTSTEWTWIFYSKKSYEHQNILVSFWLTLNLPKTTIVAQPFLMFCWPCIIVT